MPVKSVRVDEDLSLPRLSAVVYDQTRQYHPFARLAAEGEWIVQPPGASRPIGRVRMNTGDEGQQEFVVYRYLNTGETTPFDGTHPTLFHAVSWLRWRLGVRPE